MEFASRENQRYFMQSLAKGLVVLQCLAEAESPLNLSQIARAAGINNATATRCCYTLARLGYVTRDESRRFHLTPRVLTLGYAAVRHMGWRQVALSYMHQLSRRIDETVNLSVLEGAELIYVGRINTARILSYELQIGSRLPLHCTSMGKALLAFSPPAKAKAIVDRLQFVALTHRTITSKAEYLAELDRVRAQGFAMNDEELSVGLRSVSAPVLDAQGWALAGLNIAVPTKRYTREAAVNALAPQAVACAAEISWALMAMELEDGGDPTAEAPPRSLAAAGRRVNRR
ncbi:MAG: IclR family transcriptional regulator C-terminal domain-containing protein [Pseudomonadota bacterium]